MACHTKGSCSYDDQSFVRVIEQVSANGPRQCAANERLFVVCNYDAPGRWKATLAPGEEVIVETDGNPGTLGNWTIQKVGFPVPIIGCADLPTKNEGGTVTNTCTAYKFQSLSTYSDGSTVFSLQQVDLLNNGSC
ncbi:MAG: hypothetical protein AAGI46_08700 [Planctomycetota bacterium]